MQLLSPQTLSEEHRFGKRPLKGHFLRLTASTDLQANASGLLVFTQDWKIVRKLTADAARSSRNTWSRSGDMAAHGLNRLNHGLTYKARAAAVKASWQNENRLRFAMKNPQPGVIALFCRWPEGRGDPPHPHRRRVDRQAAGWPMALPVRQREVLSRAHLSAPQPCLRRPLIIRIAHMIHNDVLRSVRYMLDISDKKDVEIIKLGGMDVTKADLKPTSKKTKKKALFALPGQGHGALSRRPGDLQARQGRKPSAQPIEVPVTNNIILKKLRVAFELKEDDMHAILKAAEFPVSKPELSALFRNSATPTTALWRPVAA
jgi:uncharacterized protein YehS (DUF1456 family)